MEDSKVNIILFGPPGAGKGTQADHLVKYFKLHKISAGDLLRNEINNKTKLGNKIKTTGEYSVVIDLHPEVDCSLSIEILSPKSSS